ncbi:MAG: hypothetical protein IT328_08855 [Caldilineaceae bacterium]|nr:hypothetical protein [Caldilineaceae bacterium]
MISADFNSSSLAATPLTMRSITKTWWPLAAGWFLMTVEIPFLSAIIARHPEPEISLASWGLVFSIALILASPAMMILSASTALSRDWVNYRQVQRYMWAITLLLTALHALLAFTPLFDLLVVGLLAAPSEIIEPARLGLVIMLPYIAGLAYRRFNYGVLIRFQHTRSVTLGAMVRLLTDLVCVGILYLLGVQSGVIIATVTFTTGIVAEAIYSGLRLRPVLNELRAVPPTNQVITLNSFAKFYVPLVMTSLLMILVQPIGTAALSRMENPLESLAVWPVIYSLIILWSSAGTAFTEAVVILLEHPRAVTALHNFTMRMATIMVGLLLLMNVTPLAQIWFENVAALPPEMSPIASWSLWVGLLLPGLAFLQSWYTGTLVNMRQTRGITESVAVSLIVHGGILYAGVVWGQAPGIYVGIVGLVAGHLARTGWLWVRTRNTMRSLRARETAPTILQSARA